MKLLEKIFWKIFPFLPLIILLSFIGIIINYYHSLIPKENIKEAVGVVIGYDKGGTSNRLAILKFSVKEKNYFSRSSDDYDIGEKFIIEYEQKNPTINQVRLDKPIFLNNEKTSFKIGIIDNYNPNYFREISFIYFVDGKQYRQSYKPIENSKTEYPNVKEARKYIVKFWDENPKRSIILLNKPTTKYLKI